MDSHFGTNGGLTLLDAVEALSTIMDSHWEESSEMIELPDDEPINWKEATWLRSRNKDEVVHVVKEIFKVILNHLKDYAENESPKGSESIESIKTIMVLVGEAAKKIDRYAHLFEANRPFKVTEFREYKLLQDFYTRKISHHVDEALLGKWILALTKKRFEEEVKAQQSGFHDLETTHVFVDLESVKRDTEYELFFIRKENGARFFNPRLIRNIKLVSDFGSFIGHEKENDPLIDLVIWRDRFFRGMALSIYEDSSSIINRSYPLISQGKDHEFVALVNKTIISLMLAANQTRLISSGSTKGCFDYFSDFQGFLRDALSHRAYQHMSAFPEEEVSPSFSASKKVIEGFLRAIFLAAGGSQETSSYIQFLLQESRLLVSQEHHKDVAHAGLLWSRLAADYAAMQKHLKQHPNGPLNCVLNVLEEGSYQLFDPYFQKMLPEGVFKIQSGNHAVKVHVLPSPTAQEFIHKAKCTDEFLSFLRTKMGHDEKMLIFNYQDRTSWREHARSSLIEGLQKEGDFGKFLTVVTLPKDTEFYNQEAPYSEDHGVHLFKDHLIEHVLDRHTGFYIPSSLRQEIDLNFVEGVFDQIHKSYFSSKNVLSKEARLDFIEIFYLFMEMKALDVISPNHLYLVCKDGVDVSRASMTDLFVFIKMLEVDPCSKVQLDHIFEGLYTPALLFRERLMLPDRFNRMLGAVKVLENAREESGSSGYIRKFKENFGPFFKNINWHISD